jgi:hypothetical protein
MHTKPSAIAPTPDGDETAAFNAAHGIAAALALMTHYAQQPCPLVAHAIAHQLGHMSRHCSKDSSRTLQSFVIALLSRWQKMACGTPVMIRH